MRAAKEASMEMRNFSVLQCVGAIYIPTPREILVADLSRHQIGVALKQIWIICVAMGKKFVPRPPKLLSHNHRQGNHKQSPGTINKSIIKFPKIEITQPFSSRKSPNLLSAHVACASCMSGLLYPRLPVCVLLFVITGMKRHRNGMFRNVFIAQLWFALVSGRCSEHDVVKTCSFACDRSMLNERVMSIVHPVVRWTAIESTADRRRRTCFGQVMTERRRMEGKYRNYNLHNGVSGWGAGCVSVLGWRQW